MNLGDLKPAKGAKTKCFRVGRGHASGNGKFAGRGHGGQKSRTGGGTRLGFEGGQLPLFRRLPQRGFTCRNSKTIISINVSLLDVFEENAIVDIKALQSKGLVSNPRDGVKILGSGDLKKKLTVKVNQYSQTAKEKIEAAGGKAEVI